MTAVDVMRLIVIGPLPPPVYGVSVSTGLVLANKQLRERFDVEHLDTSDHRTGANIGRWDLTNVLLGISGVVRLNRRLAGERGIVYVPISQSTGGFLRDSLLIRSAARRKWTVVAHLRGGEFSAFYARQPRLFQR